MSNEPWRIGVDVGGTKIVAALVDAEGTVHAQLRDEHRGADHDEVVDRVVAFVQELAALAGEQGARGVAGVGVAVAAFLTADRLEVREAANLRWPTSRLAERLTKRIGLPVALENDADAAAWGEWRFGAGRDARCLLLVTLGTGVGGGVVADGRLFTGGNGLALEIGHLQVERGGRECPCGAHGCLEQYASGAALGRVARAAASEDPAAAALLLELSGGDEDAITGALVGAAAERGDAVALGACRTIGGWLGLGLAQSCAILDPSLILIGGGASAAGPVILEEARVALRRHVGAPNVRPDVPIRLAALGDAAGLVGAADRACSSVRQHAQA